MRTFLCVLLISLFIPSALFAKEKEIEVIGSNSIIHKHDCVDERGCSLKRIEYLAEDYRIRIENEYHFGTRLRASYETGSVETLQDYVFVQFVRGCVYSSEMNRRGEVRIWHDITLDHFNYSITFLLHNWVIDSIDADPAYFSSLSLPRHFFYRWEGRGGKRRWYGEEKPPYPKLHVVDHPSQAFVYTGRARNVSLQFRTCLYRARDVPVSTRPHDVNFALPLRCFYWQSFFVYDHQERVFKRPNEIAAACR